MFKAKKQKLALVVILSGTLFLSFQSAWAAFSLSVRPYIGGYELRYDKLNTAGGRVNKEVSVNITSDIGKQYRLLQTFVQPLTTDEGNRLPNNSFVVYAIRGTNRYGTLNVLQEIPLYMDRQVLYTSDSAGDGDSFTLVYGLIPTSDIAPGNYRGRLAFTLEPLGGSTQQAATVILDISAQIEVNSSVEIKTASGTKDIVLKADKAETSSAGIMVNIKGGFGRQFRILQLVSEQPISNDGKTLDWQAVTFSGSDARKGTVINVATPLSAMQQPLYNSSLAGDADAFGVQYSLSEISKQKAGKYKTRIRYLLEGAGLAQTQLIDTLNLEIDNPQIFDLIITPENQKGTLEFVNLRPDGQPQKNEVIIQVNSNTGKPYQVTQNLYSELKNKEGETINAKYFNLRTDSLETLGTLKFATAEAVKKGETVLFISDKEGSSDKFRVVYELAPSRDLKYGDYSSAITYSLSQI